MRQRLERRTAAISHDTAWRFGGLIALRGGTGHLSTGSQPRHGRESIHSRISASRQATEVSLSGVRFWELTRELEAVYRHTGEVP